MMGWEHCTRSDDGQDYNCEVVMEDTGLLPPVADSLYRQPTKCLACGRRVRLLVWRERDDDGAVAG